MVKQIQSDTFFSQHFVHFAPAIKASVIFFLTSLANNLIYESHCDLYGLQILRLGRIFSMKNATKKAAKKAAKKPAKKKK